MPTTKPEPNQSQNSGLYVQLKEGEQLVFPLKHTEVKAKIAGNLSRVEVTQTFENPFTKPLEAVYVFGLPDAAAVDDMEIKIGRRIIKGNIKKREEAQRIYEQAKQQGRTAGLLEQERDNIFTQSLANIKPGEEIDVTIRYTDSLKFAGGNYEFVFPMVVGPRYIPGTPIDSSADTDTVPDASRITPPIIPPGMRSRHDINVTVEIDAGVLISNVVSPSHQIQITQEKQIVCVKLAGEDTIPNKDFILRYQVAGKETQSTVLTQADFRGGHFAIYLIPALAYNTDEIVPKDVVFLVDTSGSQAGEPLQKCQELMRRFINNLNPDDTFSILDFSYTVRQLSATPLPNTPENRTQAIAYINNLRAAGGTQMLGGIRAAINFPTPQGRVRSIVLLSDGYIGNENEILAEVQKHLQPGNRVYSFGAGSSVNRFLLNRIAEVGQGTSRIIRHDEPTEEVAEKFFRQINNPVLINIEISWLGDSEAPVIYPAKAPDLFAEQPLVLFGRKQDRTSGNLRISGTAAGGKRYENTFHLIFESTGNPAVAQLWGRDRIKDLMNQMFSYETKTGVEAVTETALNYQLLCQYTAFVAVSDDVREEGEVISIQVPVEMPEAVSYQGIFGAPVAGTMFRGLSNINSTVASPGFAVTDWMEQDRTAIRTSINRVTWKQSVSNAKELKLQPNIEEQDYQARLFEAQRFLQDGDKVLVIVSLRGWNASNLAKQLLKRLAADLTQFAEVEITPKRKRDYMKMLLSPKATTRNQPLEIISVTQLDAAATADLTQHLQQLNLPDSTGGEIIFEFTVSKGRVGRVMLDEDASTLKQADVVEMIKKSLLTWIPSSVTGNVVLTLRIH